MARTTWRYSVSYGLTGCYLPNSVSGPHMGHTRRELADLIRSQLEMYDMPATRFADVGINRLWHHIKRHGSSSAHFRLDHTHGHSLAFSGLTEDEYNEQEAQND